MPVILFPIAMFLIGITAAIGWVMNLVKAIAFLGDPNVTPWFIARVVGIFAPPIGAVLGFF